MNNAAGCVSWRTNAPTVRGVDYHGSSVRYNLVDLCVFKGISSHGAHYSNLPNHLDGATYWNYRNVGPDLGVYDFWGIQGSGNYPSGVTSVRPQFIGYHGASATFLNAGQIRSQGNPVSPASLYEAQLAERLGSTPEWVGLALREHDELYGRLEEPLYEPAAPLRHGGR